jgi:hypothetical protein
MHWPELLAMARSLANAYALYLKTRPSARCVWGGGGGGTCLFIAVCVR